VGAPGRMKLVAVLIGRGLVLPLALLSATERTPLTLRQFCAPSGLKELMSTFFPPADSRAPIAWKRLIRLYRRALLLPSNLGKFSFSRDFPFTEE